MPAMKISLDAAMRARDVSKPTAADDIAAAQIAGSGGQGPESGRPRPQGAAAGPQGQPATGRPRKPSRRPDRSAAS